jgi:hypothetical protein
MLNETKAGIEKEINQIRLAINGYLDKLEKELLTKLQEASDSAKGQIMENHLTNVPFLGQNLSSLRYLRRLPVELDLCNFCGL